MRPYCWCTAIVLLLLSLSASSDDEPTGGQREVVRAEGQVHQPVNENDTASEEGVIDASFWNVMTCIQH